VTDARIAIGIAAVLLLATPYLLRRRVITGRQTEEPDQSPVTAA
jgi:hypothetical protein